MMYGIDMLDKVLSDEQTQDPSVTPDTSILDLQAIVSRLDRLEQEISTLRQTTAPNDNSADNGNENNIGNSTDNTGDDDNEG